MRETIKRCINEILAFCLNNKILSKIVRIIYNFIIKLGIIFNSKKIENEKNNYEEILEDYSPRPKEKTYYGENKIVSEEYDLQIIVPAYNVEKYIEECIDSILNQKTKYKVLTVIINDGSTDNTGKILEKYKNLPNIEIITQENQGLSGARNSGIKEIKAKYLFFLDSDDILFENAIEKLLNIAFQNSVDIVEGSFKRFYMNKIISGVKHKNKLKEKSSSIGLFGFAWGKVIKNSIFLNLKFPLDYIYEDTIFSYLIYPKDYLTTIIEEDIYNYRVNTKSITHTFKVNKRNIETFYIMKEMLENGIKLYDIKIDKNLYLNFLGQVRLNYTRTINCPEEIKQAIFFETKNLLIKYFSKNLLLENYLDKELVKSLLENNYGKYKFICKYGRKL